VPLKLRPYIWRFTNKLIIIIIIIIIIIKPTDKKNLRLAKGES